MWLRAITVASAMAAGVVGVAEVAVVALLAAHPATSSSRKAFFMARAYQRRPPRELRYWMSRSCSGCTGRAFAG